MKYLPTAWKTDIRMKLKFYTRPDCDLCNKAETLLAEGGFGSAYEKVDIESDIELLDRYGDKIPVIHNTETGEKLAWPFTASQVRELVAD